MGSYRQIAAILCLMLVTCFSHYAGAAEAGDQNRQGSDLPPLTPEDPGAINSLPAKYPSHWVLVHDAAFFHMLEGRVIVIDAAADTLARQYKGMFNVSFMGNIAQATTRPELYATEIFYTRGTRGKRTDVLTIFDKSNLKAIGEVVLPGDKSFRGMPERYAVTLIDNEKLLLVFNLNPATSVSVIDIIKRTILSEVSTPGCSLIYPTGTRGFSSLCSNGGILTTQLDPAGRIISQQRLDPFFSVADAPVFERPAIIDGIAYFPDFLGDIHPVDLNGAVAIPAPPWPLVTVEERNTGWRPSGIGIIDTDMAGNFYVIMQTGGHEGSQGEGGREVWVVHAQSKKRLRRITLQTQGLSLGVTKDRDPLLVVTNTDMNLDVYGANSGAYIRTISGFGQETPLMLFGAQ
jgi:methylamine dehydrogenase heavy chain